MKIELQQTFEQKDEGKSGKQLRENSLKVKLIINKYEGTNLKQK